MARICLSFDNGPDPEVTPTVLDVLAQHELRASFFVLGHKLAEPSGLALARRIRDAGHRLGNHSFSHETPLGEDPRPDAVEIEIAETEALLRPVWDAPRLFRPFGGGGVLGPHLLSPASVEYLRARRYTCVLWNCVPGDWKDAEGWVEVALRDADAAGDEGHLLVVLHDFMPEPMAHLDRFLTELRARGHSFTHELPEDCLPMVEGEPRPDLDDYVASATRP